MEPIQDITKALLTSQRLAKTAKVLHAAQIAALGGAAASLAIGGIRFFRQSTGNKHS